MSIMLMRPGNYPKRLYKYTHLGQRQFGSTQQCDHVKDLFANNRFYCSSPITFNDPFDCNPIIDHSGTDKDWRKILKMDAKKHHPEYSGKQIYAKISDFNRSRKNSPNLLREFEEDLVEKIRRQFGVVCFTELSNSILMYSHYSDSHRGFAIEIDTSDEKLITGMLQPVRYVAERPVYNVMTASDDDNYIAFALTKAEIWAYEREWRLASFPIPNSDGDKLVGGAGSYLVFDPDIVIGVIFGCQMCDDDKEVVRSFAKNHRNIRYYQAEAMKNQYSLSIVPLPT